MKFLFLSFQKTILKIILKIIAIFEKTIIFATSLLNMRLTNVEMFLFNLSSR